MVRGIAEGNPMKLAILDDYQQMALRSADWDRVRNRGVEIEVFEHPFASQEHAAEKLAPFQIVLLMRERTPFPRSLIQRLGKLELVVLTGSRSPSLDIKACTERGIPITHTGSGNITASTSELTFGLLLAAARDLARADRGVRAGGWLQGIAGGAVLDGSRLGILGFGKLGSRVARYGRAFGMDVVAWSPSLTEEKAAAGGARLVSKDELLATSDFVTIHVVLSDSSRGMIGAPELAAMKRGAVLINTSRGPIVDETAMIAALKSGHLGHASLDVYDREPLPADHELRTLENITLSPHLGYLSQDIYRVFYGDALASIEAWMDSKPIRILNPEALGQP